MASPNGNQRRPSHEQEVYLRSNNSELQIPNRDADATLYLPDTAYSHSKKGSKSKLSVSTDLSPRPVRPYYGQLDGPFDVEPSPDPHEYYRQLQDPFAPNNGEANGQSDGIKPQHQQNTRARRKSSFSSSCSGSTPPASAVSRANQPYPPSSSYRERTGSTKSSTSVTSLGQPRHASFQDLVAKFDKGGAPRPVYRPGSRNISPVTSRAPDRAFKNTPTSRNGSQVNTSRQVSREQGTVKNTNNGHRTASVKQAASIATSPIASQSLVDLPSSGNMGRQPLFGEILPSTLSANPLPHGVPQPPRRRGSVDSSVHSPNPMFSNSNAGFDSAVETPISPDSWYRNFDSGNGVSDGQHRRSRSDFGFKPIVPPSLSTLQSVKAGESANDTTSLSPANSFQSRIPVRRRHSHASETLSSNPPSRSTSKMTSRQDDSPPTVRKKPSRSAPRPTSPTSRLGSASASGNRSPNKTPVRGDRSRGPQTNGKSPLLRANIIAMPPKASPPLRSSRPRLPISTVSNSRSRPVEKQLFRPPELDNIDLAARRQKIFQAYNRSVREVVEKEKIEERQRRLRDKKEADAAARRNDSTRTIRPGDVLTDSGTLASEESRRDKHRRGVSGSSRVSHEGRSTGPRSHRSAASSFSDSHGHPAFGHNDENPAEDDSPTLGRQHHLTSGTVRRARSPGAGTDLPPSSAVTVDSDGTMFDNEVQDDELPETSSSHRTVLSQVMDMRASSASESGCDSDDDSERGRESVQIVFQTEAPLVPNQNNHDVVGGQNGYEERLEQWSTGSWTSSIRDDVPLDPIAEGSPDQSHPRASPSFASPSRSKSPGAKVEGQSSAETDAFNSVSRVLEGEDRKTPVNRSHFGDIYQKILEQSPDLARQGGWDTQRVTQLCLQEMDRSKYERLSKAASPLKKNKEVRKVASSPAKSPGKRLGEKSSRSENRSGQGHKYRSSLNSAADFASTSPSIVDWMRYATLDSPVDRDGEDVRPPQPPPKDPNASTPSELTTPTTESRDSLGLNIRIRSPLRVPPSPSPPIRPPTHSPPPPPVHRLLDDTSHSVVQSPGVFDDNEGSSSAIIGPSHYGKMPPPPIPGRVTQPRTGSPAQSIEALTKSPPEPSVVAFASQPEEQLGLEPTNSTTTSDPRTADQKRVTRRKHVIKELVDTEAAFGRDMSVVDDIYKGTSSSCLDLSPEDIRILFGNSAQIVKFSMDFLDALKQAAKTVYIMPPSQRFQGMQSSRTPSASTGATSTSEDQVSAETDEPPTVEQDRGTSIGEVFKRHMDEMEKVFTAYLKNHDQANQKLQALQQNRKVKIWLTQCHEFAADLTKAWDLDSLLVKPVQRLLKYPLFLGQLVETTPADHPDHEGLLEAVRELTAVSVRINDLKKHSELVEQSLRRNRKESIGFSKAIGRQTEKLRQNVGVSKVIEDKEYIALRERYQENIAHLILVREDVRTYVTEATKAGHRFNEMAMAIDAWIDVGHTMFQERESKWRQFAMNLRELVSVAVPEHIEAININVVDPMYAAGKMLESLLKDNKGLLQKRDKRAIDYARWKNAQDRGEKIDKKTISRMEQWEALNREAKERLEKLIDRTGQLSQQCLKTFVQIQCTWSMMWQRKLSGVIGPVSPEVSTIAREWQEDFDYHEAQALTLGICNGSLLAEAINILNITPLTGMDSNSPGPSWAGNKPGSISIRSEISRHSGSFTQSPLAESYHDRPFHPLPGRAPRRISAASATGSTSDTRNASTTALTAAAIMGPISTRPATAGDGGRRSPAPPRLSLDAPSPTLGVIKPRSPDPANNNSNPSSSTQYSANGATPSTLTPQSAFSPVPPGAFPTSATSNSASPASDPFHSASATPLMGTDSPRQSTATATSITLTADTASTLTTDNRMPAATAATRHRSVEVLFLVASLHAFEINPSHVVDGFPYLSYGPGDIFDVIGEKEELYLAKNQDDPNEVFGWIWNRHFAKIAEI